MSSSFIYLLKMYVNPAEGWKGMKKIQAPFDIK